MDSQRNPRLMRLTPFALIAVFLFAACSGTETAQTPARVLTTLNISALPGWEQDNVAEALPALQRSCAVMQKKEGWQTPCAAIGRIAANDSNALRHVLADMFTAYAVSDRSNANGLFTGYYEAELQGSATRHGPFQTPIYARPDDLIAVDLGDFKSEWKGKHLAGKVVGRHLKPYDERGAIAKGSLQSRAQVLAWVDDPVSAFFLAVQGSGRIRLDNGQILRAGYDGTNGRDYVAIGKSMADEGALQKPVSLQSIRAWLAAHPDRAESVMDHNPSYVFFRLLNGEGPVGAQGVALTPERSLAVDPSVIHLGAPVWLDSADGEGRKLQRLMVAQDTGGAIKGVVRGDFFWGYGASAEAKAGPMQSDGRYYLLLPKSVIP